MSFTRTHRIAFSASLAAIALSCTATAETVTIVNGNFTQGVASSSEFGGRYPSVQVTGWSTNGYNFVFTPGTADPIGATGEFGYVSLWGPLNGSNNGFTATAPGGGNIIAADGDFLTSPISQTLTGLTPGSPTTISFYFAGAQQSAIDFTAPTTEQFLVSLGSQTLSTPVLHNAGEGFTGWQQENLTFTPTTTSEVLSFLAIGTPDGEPPMSLLADVSASNTATPEPGSLLLLGTGIAAIAGLITSRFRKPAN